MRGVGRQVVTQCSLFSMFYSLGPLSSYHFVFALSLSFSISYFVLVIVFVSLMSLCLHLNLFNKPLHSLDPLSSSYSPQTLSPTAVTILADFKSIRPPLHSPFVDPENTSTALNRPHIGSLQRYLSKIFAIGDYTNSTIQHHISS